MNTTYILAQATAEQGSPYSMLITFVLIGIIFYFMLIRPAQKQQKAQKQLHEGLKSGDKVVTSGGIYGIIREVQEGAVKLEIAPNTVIKVTKSSIAAAVAKDGSVPAGK
ncbi:MAG: preprotein translocase subunit YajC [Akkermansia sp.]